MAIDIVCPLGKNSKWFDNELKYSLRSIEKFGKNIGRIFIIGEYPDFLLAEFLSCDLYHIPSTDKYGHERNIHEKIKIACLDERISENFLFWNDDFFLTQEIDLEQYPYYENGTLRNQIDKRIRFDGYRFSLQNTEDFLRQRGLFTMMHDIHCPIIYNKKKYLNLMEQVDWTARGGYVIKSLYANYYKEKIVFMEDLKFTESIGLDEIKTKIKDRHIFSIADTVMMCPSKTMKTFLEESYSNKSKYEK